MLTIYLELPVVDVLTLSVAMTSISHGSKKFPTVKSHLLQMTATHELMFESSIHLFQVINVIH